MLILTQKYEITPLVNCDYEGFGETDHLRITRS